MIKNETDATVIMTMNAVDTTKNQNMRRRDHQLNHVHSKFNSKKFIFNPASPL